MLGNRPKTLISRRFLLRFLTSQLLATLHPKIKPSKPQICLKMPSWTPQEGPRRAQDSPRWAQDGPKTGRGTTTKSCKILFGALLGPSWATSGLQAPNLPQDAFLDPPRRAKNPPRGGGIIDGGTPFFDLHLSRPLGTDLRPILSPSWAHFGPILGPSWAILGLSWAILGLSWPILGPSWTIFGPSWAILGHLGPVFGPSWAIVGPSVFHTVTRSIT